MENDLKLILVSPQPELCQAWQKRFDGLSNNVEIVNGYFQNLPEFDCMVSAANSFGLMDGGVDLAIIQFFGDELMWRVQQRILADYRGEQPVGTSMIVETDDSKHPYLAHTPTMRVPMEIRHTDNAYLAMWAMLLTIYRHNQTGKKPIKTIACPGLGTGIGKVSFGEAARQMALAYQHFLKPPRQIDWRFADERQNKVKYGGDFGFHIPPDMEWN